MRNYKLGDNILPKKRIQGSTNVDEYMTDSFDNTDDDIYYGDSRVSTQKKSIRKVEAYAEMTSSLLLEYNNNRKNHGDNNLKTEEARKRYYAAVKQYGDYVGKVNADSTDDLDGESYLKSRDNIRDKTNARIQKETQAILESKNYGKRDNTETKPHYYQEGAPDQNDPHEEFDWLKPKLQQGGKINMSNLRMAAEGMQDPNAMPPAGAPPEQGMPPQGGDPAAQGGGQQDPCAMLQEVMGQLPPEMQQGAQQAIQSGQCEQFIMQLQQQMQGGGDPAAQGGAPPPPPQGDPAAGGMPPQGQPMMRNGGMLRAYKAENGLRGRLREKFKTKKYREEQAAKKSEKDAETEAIEKADIKRIKENIDKYEKELSNGTPNKEYVDPLVSKNGSLTSMMEGMNKGNEMADNKSSKSSSVNHRKSLAIREGYDMEVDDSSYENNDTENTEYEDLRAKGYDDKQATEYLRIQSDVGKQQGIGLKERDKKVAAIKAAEAKRLAALEEKKKNPTTTGGANTTAATTTGGADTTAATTTGGADTTAATTTGGANTTAATEKNPELEYDANGGVVGTRNSEIVYDDKTGMPFKDGNGNPVKKMESGGKVGMRGAPSCGCGK